MKGRTTGVGGRVGNRHNSVGIRLTILTGFVVALAACAYRTTAPVEPAPYTTTTKYTVSLFATKTASQEGDIQTLAGQKVIKGACEVTWQITVPAAGEYEAILAYASHNGQNTIEIVCEASRVVDHLPPTSGVYLESGQWYQNSFVRRKLPGTLTLGQETVTVSLRTLDTTEDSAVVLYSIELQRLEDREKIAAEMERAVQSRPNSDWFVEMSYGLMFHWTSQAAPRTGSTRPYKDAVNDFDVDAFVRMVEETGADYVIFTGNHAEPHFPAPLKEWEKLFPGWTTERDLIAEIADGLKERDIKLLLYLATHVYAKLGKVEDREFSEINHTLITEIGSRYGDKISGYWLDGWYQSSQRYWDFPFESFYRAAKAGNAERLLALNSWLYPIATPWQDYWAGEIYSLGVPPPHRIIQDGPGESLHYHALLALEGDWVHTKENTPIKAPVLDTRALLAFMKGCAGKGPVTLNVLIYQDGTISDSSMNVLQAVNAAIHHGQMPEGIDHAKAGPTPAEEGSIPLERSTVVQAEQEGTVVLAAQDAKIHGVYAARGPDYIGGWGNASTFVSWDFDAPKPGRYRVDLHAACGTDHGGDFEIVLGETVFSVKTKDTGTFANPQIDTIGVVDLTKSTAACRLLVKPIRIWKQGRALMNLHAIHLVPVAD